MLKTLCFLHGKTYSLPPVVKPHTNIDCSLSNGITGTYVRQNLISPLHYPGPNGEKQKLTHSQVDDTDRYADNRAEQTY